MRVLSEGEAEEGETPVSSRKEEAPIVAVVDVDGWVRVRLVSVGGIGRWRLLMLDLQDRWTGDGSNINAGDVVLLLAGHWCQAGWSSRGTISGRRLIWTRSSAAHSTSNDIAAMLDARSVDSSVMSRSSIHVGALGIGCCLL